MESDEYRTAKAYYTLDTFAEEIQESLHATSGEVLDEVRGVWEAVLKRWVEVRAEMDRLLSGREPKRARSGHEGQEGVEGPKSARVCP